MKTFEHRYLDLLAITVKAGKLRPSRVGHTYQHFGITLGFNDLKLGKFPILTTRRMYPKGIWGELAAFLRGATLLQEFKDFGCNYWDDNAEKWLPNKNLPKEHWHVGKIYGAQWRNFGEGTDQIRMLVDGLKTDPYGRRHLLTTYDPSTLWAGCLPPCHLLTQFNVTTDGCLDALVYMRSVDVALGLPADIVLYATLLLLVAKETGYKPGNLGFMLGDTHVYTKHADQVLEQVQREVLEPPSYELANEATLDNFVPEHIKLVDYQYHEPIKYELFT